jgi:hypothetical protein
MKKGIIIGVLIVLIVLSLVLFSGKIKESPTNKCSSCNSDYGCSFTQTGKIIDCECIERGTRTPCLVDDDWEPSMGLVDDDWEPSEG